MDYSAFSDIGKVRSSNQDSYLCGEFDDGTVWAVVCDGMGGVSGGKVASKMCVETVSNHILKGYRHGMSSSSVKNLLESAVSTSNIEIFDTAKDDSSLFGMGTTVVAALIFDGIAVIAHAGDSRAYLLNDGTISQITKDHSVVQYLIDIGKITPDEAKTHPDRNVITRAVGVDCEIRTDIDIADFEPGNLLLLCTDGLTGSLRDEEIYNISKESVDCETISKSLVYAANECGGRDNITVVCVKR